MEHSILMRPIAQNAWYVRFTSQSDRGLEIGREDRCCPEIAHHGLARVNSGTEIESFVAVLPCQVKNVAQEVAE
jgi:hypothetical protein